MNTSYNRIAGTSVERLAALSDGIFGVAMTLLLLELRIPAKELIHNEGDLWRALGGLAPHLLVYLMSFITLGIFWVGQQTQLSNLAHSNRNLTWLFLTFLFTVTLVPFTTRLLSEYIDFRAALIPYWVNILLLGVFLYMTWGYANRAGLIKDTVPQADRAAICHRIIIAQLLYAVGALLCIFSTYWSIGFIVLVQLNYSIAPMQWLRKRIGSVENQSRDS